MEQLIDDSPEKEQALLREAAEIKEALRKATLALEAAGVKAPEIKPAQAGVPESIVDRVPEVVVPPERKSPGIKVEPGSKEDFSTKKPKTEDSLGTKTSEDNDRKFLAAREVESFIESLNIKDLIGPEFKALSSEQQLLVVRNLQNRVVDIVKSDARTQYSEDIKGKPFLKKIWASVKKEGAVKNLEADLFAKIRDTDDGRKMIVGDFQQLTRMAREREVEINEKGKPEIILIPVQPYNTEEEVSATKEFNTAANNFIEKPYEWSQEKGKNKKRYDEAKDRYNTARNAMLEVGGKTMGKERAMSFLLKFDNQVQMDQLLNTHPQVEKEFQRISETAGGRETTKTGLNFLQTMTGGKNLTNKLLFVGGYGLRAATASMGLAAGIAAPITGAIVGGARGYFRGKQTLEERKIQARHGQKDASKERVITTDITRLTSQLQKLVDEINQPAITPKQIAWRRKNLSMLALRIEHTQGKIEKGQVNFGDAKSALINQYNLANTLNNALVVQEVTSGQSSVEFRKRIDNLLTVHSEYANEKISEAQTKFIRKQVGKAAMYGAGAAIAGYTVRYIGEHLGLWGHHAVEQATQKSAVQEKFTDVRSGSSTITHADTVRVDSNLSQHPDTTSVAHDTTKVVETTPTAPIISPEHATIAVDHDAIIGKGEGIEHALRRQIEHTHGLAEKLGYKGDINDAKSLHEFSGRMAHQEAIKYGYVKGNTEDWVKEPGKVAYQFQRDADGNVTGIAELDANDGHVIGDSSTLNDYETLHTNVAKHISEIKTEVPSGASSVENAHAKVLEDYGNPKLSATEYGNPMRPYDGTEPQPNNYAGGASDPLFQKDWMSYKNVTGTALVGEKVSPESVLSQHTETDTKLHFGANTEEGGRHLRRLYGENSGQYESRATYRPYNGGRPVRGAYNDNLYRIDYEAIHQQADEISRSNLHHVFLSNRQETWNAFSKQPASAIMKMGETGSGGEGVSRLVSYMRKLERVTGLKPKGRFLFLRGVENTEHYIRRALRRAVEMGAEDEVTIE